MKAVLSLPLVLALSVGTGAAMAADATKTAADKPAEPARATTSVAATGAAATAAGAANRPATRDWAQVDKNRDNLVSPDEMEAYLVANPGPLKGR